MGDPVKHSHIDFPRKERLEEYGFYAVCLTLFLMPFPRSWSLWAMGAFLFFGLLIWLKQIKRIAGTFRTKLWLILPPTTYFLINLIWFLYNPEWTYLEDKLMFLLIPVLGFPIFMSEYFAEKSANAFRAFIFGIALICIFNLARAVWNSLSFADGHISFNSMVDFSISATSGDYFSAMSRFRSAQLSSFEHPIYISIKAIFAIVLLIELRNSLKISNRFRLILISLLLVFVFLLSSRVAYIIVIIILVFYISKFLSSSKVKWILIPVIPVIIFSAYKISVLNPRIREKSDLMFFNIRTGGGDLKKIDPRLLSWFTASELIAKSPVFGLGPDVRGILASEYEKNGYLNEARLRLNAHNQFLETQLSYGIPGTLILFWMLLTLLLNKKKFRNPDLVVPFLIIVSVCMLFESILVRQWGIMFFVLFYCILTIPEKSPQH
jgi:O-antigen ligase